MVGTQLELPDNREGHGPYQAVYDDGEGGNCDVDSILVAAVSTWNSLIPIELKWLAQRQRCNDDEKAPTEIKREDNVCWKAVSLRSCSSTITDSWRTSISEPS